ncbi:general substrate transporter [Amylocarpus encephaloides]|uniref:General substrate transporter n=1 Tax=Amylocarpus encephaloides TaxID=45428 RepID=A0A9P7YA31_9HELO|nr:general substrate transporter [Amylocarpus encephaloides]
MFSPISRIPKYVQAATLISIGGLLFGLDTGTIGPLTTMPQYYESFGHISSTIHGLVVSTILITASISSFFGGHVANSLGRLRGVAIGSAIFGAGAAIEGGSVKLGMLITGRAIKGIGEGTFLSTSIVYITEISPPQYRGTLASIPQLFTTVGLCAGYFICYGTVNISSSISWRLPFLLQAGISFLFSTSTLLLLPESPRWLSSHGRKQQALAAWNSLQIATAEREKEDEIPNAQEMQPVKTKDILGVFGRDVWKQTSLGVFLMSMQQLTGIDGILYYAPLLFASAGLKSSTASFLASGISGLLILLVTIPAFLLADKWGRKTASMLGGFFQMGLLFLIGSLYATGAVHEEHGVARWVVIISIFAFAVVFSGTWGVSFRVYISEIQPPKTRAGATSLSLSANWVMNWIVAFTTPIFLAHSSFGVYFLWGSFALITVVVCALFMPETRGKSLEEIDASFKHTGHDVEKIDTPLVSSSTSVKPNTVICAKEAGIS